MKHFERTKQLIKWAELYGIKRRWFETNKSLQNRILKVKADWQGIIEKYNKMRAR
jgi:hypothetical protein